MLCNKTKGLYSVVCDRSCWKAIPLQRDAQTVSENRTLRESGFRLQRSLRNASATFCRVGAAAVKRAHDAPLPQADLPRFGSEFRQFALESFIIAGPSIVPASHDQSDTSGFRTIRLRPRRCSVSAQEPVRTIELIKTPRCHDAGRSPRPGFDRSHSAGSG